MRRHEAMNNARAVANTASDIRYVHRRRVQKGKDEPAHIPHLEEKQGATPKVLKAVKVAAPHLHTLPAARLSKGVGWSSGGYSSTQGALSIPN